MEETKKYIDEKLLPIIKETGELLEGNIFMSHKTFYYTPRFINKIKNINTFSKNAKNILEIGFNSGFSTLLMLLSNPNSKITCLDIGVHKYTLPCYNKLKEDFGDRVNLIIGDSMETILTLTDKYDLIHIDGGHTIKVATSDIDKSMLLTEKNTIVIMDDYDIPTIKKVWDKAVVKYNLKSIDYAETKYHDIKIVNYEKNEKIRHPTLNWKVYDRNGYYYTHGCMIKNHLKYWDDIIPKKIDRYLEIGSLQGNSATHFLNNYDIGSMVCCEPFGRTKTVPDKELFLLNIEKTGQKDKVDLVELMSDDFFKQNKKTYDFIYIDGSHEYLQVKKDTINGWKCLDIGGIMIFDDYKMCTLYTDDGIGAKPAIDEFLKTYEGEYELLVKKYQVIIKRLK